MGAFKAQRQTITPTKPLALIAQGAAACQRIAPFGVGFLAHVAQNAQRYGGFYMAQRALQMPRAVYLHARSELGALRAIYAFAGKKRAWLSPWKILLA